MIPASSRSWSKASRLASTRRGNFSAEVTLETGDNLITVTATDDHGNQASESFVVRHEPTGGP